MTKSAKTEFELKHPFEFKGATYMSFELRRPKVRDLREFLKNVDKDGMGAIQTVIANLAETDDKVIQEIDLEDFGPIKKWFEDFLKPMLGDFERIIPDSFPIFERFKWTLEDVERLEWEDFMLIADAVGELNQRDADEIKKAREGR